MTPRPGNILISSAGRRVSLMRAFERSAAALDPSIRVLACDASPLSAALQSVASGFVAPRCTDGRFVPWLVDLCARERVGLIVPTIDTELPVLAAAKDALSAVGVTVAVSSVATAEIGGDKVKTHEWLVETGFPTVRQYSIDSCGAAAWPLLAKPRFGSASIGIQRLADQSQLSRLDPSTEYVLQEIAQGKELTVDVLVLEGKCVAAVPRERLEVRAGEVSKGVTRNVPALETLAHKIAEALPGGFAAMNIQVFVDRSDDMNVIEMNPRFGGGFPLSYAAGADFPKWLMEYVFGYPSTAQNSWRQDLVMLRYDEAVFVDEKALVR